MSRHQLLYLNTVYQRRRAEGWITANLLLFFTIHQIFEYAQNPVKLQSSTSSTNISNSIFRYNQYGLSIGSGSAYILNSQIYNSTSYGIYFLYPYASDTIINISLM